MKHVLLFVTGLSVALHGLAWPWSKRTWEETLKQVETRFSEVSQLSTQAVADRLASQTANTSPIILDVRTAAEFEISHLPEAMRVDDLDGALTLLQSESKMREIIVYCSVGWRSSQLAQALIAEGYRNIRNMRGGLFLWANEGRSMVDSHGAASTVHPYNEDWGQLLTPAKRAQVSEL